jgi:hypothetical protein
MTYAAFRAAAEFSRRKYPMKLYVANVVLENREERKVVASSLLRIVVRALRLCWTCRHSLAGVSLAGGKRSVEIYPLAEQEENPVPKPTEGGMLIPGWLAEPITEEFWFPAERE